MTVETQIVSDEEAETVDFLMCVRKGTPTRFSDNLEGVCSECGSAIVFRPHAPRAPPKLCIECFVDRFGNRGTA